MSTMQTYAAALQGCVVVGNDRIAEHQYYRAFVVAGAHPDTARWLARYVGWEDEERLSSIVRRRILWVRAALGWDTGIVTRTCIQRPYGKRCETTIELSINLVAVNVDSPEQWMCEPHKAASNTCYGTEWIKRPVHRAFSDARTPTMVQS